MDDDPFKRDKEIGGLPVLGCSQELKELVKEYLIDKIVVAITHEKSSQLISVLFWTGDIGSTEMVTINQLADMIMKIAGQELRKHTHFWPPRR